MIYPFLGNFCRMLALNLGGTCEKQTLDLANLGKSRHIHSTASIGSVPPGFQPCSLPFKYLDIIINASIA